MDLVLADLVLRQLSVLQQVSAFDLGSVSVFYFVVVFELDSLVGLPQLQLASFFYYFFYACLFLAHQNELNYLAPQHLQNLLFQEFLFQTHTLLTK